MNWWTSDTHFGHVNVIRLSKRPFASVEEMNEELVRRWNARVAHDDTVYHLGDFALGPRETAGIWRPRLNGNIVLILGNHDRSKTAMREAGFDVVLNRLDTTIDGINVTMRHAPPAPEHREKLGCDLFLHGHVHEAWVQRGKCFNVGVDVRGFQPVTLEEMLSGSDTFWP
jgi:calcineurin-like phosphoesterase family protein